MSRILVVGGAGFFGRAAVELLRAGGLEPRTAARHPSAELRLEADDPASVRSALRPGDVVIDAAGPFQQRSTALVEGAIEVGCHVLDLSDSIDYTAAVRTLAPSAARAGVALLSACSSVATVAAALVRASGILRPRRLAICLSPATRETANSGTSGSLVHSLGRPIRVFRGGTLQPAVGWRESRRFRMPAPIGRCRGFLMESVGAITLPPIWPSLQEVGFWVDSRVPGLNLVFALAARFAPLRRLITRRQAGGVRVARRLGSNCGGMQVEIEGEAGTCARQTIFARRRSYLAAVAPAALAARALVEGRLQARGWIDNDRQVEPKALIEYLEALGITRV